MSNFNGMPDGNGRGGILDHRNPSGHRPNSGGNGNQTIHVNHQQDPTPSLGRPQNAQAHMGAPAAQRGYSMPQPMNNLGGDMQSIYGTNMNNVTPDLSMFQNMMTPIPNYSFPMQYPPTQVPARPEGPRLADRLPVFDGVTLDMLNIFFGVINNDERRRAVERKVVEYFHDTLDHPPVLPENTIPQMGPKDVFPDFVKYPDTSPTNNLSAARRMNDSIASKSQTVDRHRNNEAAKRSRKVKAENLENANIQLVENTLHIAWLQGQLCALGGRPEAYDEVSELTKENIYKLITSKREVNYEKRKKEKLRRDAKKRSEQSKKRHRQKRELNERTARATALLALNPDGEVKVPTLDDPLPSDAPQTGGNGGNGATSTSILVVPDAPPVTFVAEVPNYDAFLT
ncbi:hypothetical protein QQS21_006487 [Conoideocrella luteorostrata]|uniref:BZIP domain-containing protein n=1 Tax=Conoideocrella luteorostrata TaxID=1105319 RepID=A0AAJ0FY78_9HYPO|nr:hypothetical protein QQS21_006487 [Conoideocrella luteorostrata]